jgi:hypothetical protein
MTGRATLEQVMKVVEVLYNRTGCVACGRLSFTLESIEELVELQSVRDVAKVGGVETVTVTGR